MGISRYFHEFSYGDALDEETFQEQEKSFDKILQKENERLMQLISENLENVNIENFYQKYNPRITDNLFFDE